MLISVGWKQSRYYLKSFVKGEETMEIMIHSNLRLLRNRRGLTLEELAVIIDVSRQTVAKWEANESYPDIENCVKLATLFKVSLDAFVKESIPLSTDEKNDNGQYIFGITKITEDGHVPLSERTRKLMEISPNDRLLILGDKDKGIAIVKCEGMNDYISKEE